MTGVGRWSFVLFVAVIAVVVVLLSGCAQYDAYTKAAAGAAADAADRERIAAEWALCKAMSVGAWVRGYGNDAVKAEAWRDLCAAPLLETPGTTP